MMLRRAADLGRAFGVALLLGTAPAQLRAAEPVAVTFAVQAEEFAANLDVGRASVEQACTATLVELLNRYFPPVGWRPAPAPGSTTQLTLSLAEEPGKFLPAVVLAWSATVDGEQKTMPELPRIMLYEPFVLERETHDPAELARDVRTALTEWFANSANRGLFQRSFLAQVPLARSVTVDPAAQRVVVPLSLAAARMDPKSTLRIVFEVLDAEGVPAIGELNVTSLLDDPASRSVPSARGKVIEFNVSNVPPVSGWSPQIPALFARPVTSRVFVDLYIYSESNTAGGNFLTP
jgi:hypothetical protein